MRFNFEPKRCKSVSLSAKRSVSTLVGLAHGVVTEKLRFKFRKIPSRPGGGHGKPFYVGLRRLYPPDPPLTEMEDRRATVTDASQSTTFRLCSSAAAPTVTGAAAPRHPLPRCQGTKCRPGTPGILEYVIRSRSFLRKGIELSNTVS